MHFTEYDTRLAAYALIVDDEQRVLLSWYNARFSGTPAWTLPGGGVEYGEQPDEALVREVKEETGYDVDLGPVLFVDTWSWPADGGRPGRAVRVVHTARVRGGVLGTLEVDGTTDRAEWVPIADLAGQERVPLVDLALARR